MDAQKRDVVALSSAGIFAGPVAWAIDLELRYALVHYVCANHAGWIMWLITLLALAAALLGVLLSARVPNRFLSLTGMLTSGMFALAIVAMSIPDLFLRACD